MIVFPKPEAYSLAEWDSTVSDHSTEGETGFQRVSGAPLWDCRQRRLRALTDLGRTLARTQGTDAVLRVTVDGAAELLRAGQAAIVVHNGRRLLELRRGQAIELLQIEGMTPDLVNFLISSRFGEVLGETYLTVPLMASDRLSGLLGVSMPADTGGTDFVEEEWFLSALADHAAVALCHGSPTVYTTNELADEIDAAFAKHSNRQMIMSSLAHDLLSPLLSIRIGCDILDNSYRDIDESDREVVGEIRTAGRYLHAIATNLVEAGRLAAGLTAVECRQVSIKPILDECMSIIAKKAEAAGQKIEISGDLNASAWADGDRLSQILVNVLSNAGKYAPDKSSIKIHIHAPGERGPDPCSRRTLISISDEGPGIPSDQLDMIFRPYYRVPGEVTQGKAGVGLGLSISRQLARKMGGDITVVSQPGQGATFTVHLPSAAS